jgi:hypothetical protein
MITFKHHIEISKNATVDNGLLNYIQQLSPEQKVSVTRDIADAYPLDMSWNDSYDIHKNFKVYKDPMDLVLGQFIMIEQIITGKTKFDTEAENDLALAELLLRPKHQEEFDNEDQETEKENKYKILESCVSEVYSVINEFLKIREQILFKQFAGVFYETPEEDEDKEEDGDPADESLFAQQWYWYSIVRMLANEDITKYDKIYMLKMSTVMPEMSFLAQKNKIESANQRQQQALSKL